MGCEGGGGGVGAKEEGVGGVWETGWDGIPTIQNPPTPFNSTGFTRGARCTTEPLRNPHPGTQADAPAAAPWDGREGSAPSGRASPAAGPAGLSLEGSLARVLRPAPGPPAQLRQTDGGPAQPRPPAPAAAAPAPLHRWPLPGCEQAATPAAPAVARPAPHLGPRWWMPLPGPPAGRFVCRQRRQGVM